MQQLLLDIGANRRVRDPIYGYIWLTEKEMKIIDTPLFQRLRRVNQLALTKYVYPTAENSRFVHSLGVTHCATEMYSWIVRNSNNGKDIGIHRSDISDLLLCLRYAALLHDIGHIAFSHAAEEELLPGLNHEDISQFIVTNYSPIADILDEKATIVRGLLTSQPKKKYEILHSIVSGQLDADRADYLLRDSYCCGVKYGEYDYKRYISSFHATQDSKNIKLYIKHRDIPVIESFLLARYHYNLQVPFHRTRVAYDKALSKYFNTLGYKAESFLTIDKSNQIKAMEFDVFLNFDDYAIFEKIKADRKENEWAKLLLRETHLKCVLDIATISADEDSKILFKKFISDLESLDLVLDDDFFVFRKSVEVSTYEEGYPATGKDDKQCFQLAVKQADGTMQSVQECSPIISKLSPTELLRIYVTEKHIEKARKLYKSLTS